MAENCVFLNMTFGVKYLYISACYAMPALWPVRGETGPRHYKQKDIPMFHVEQFLFVHMKTI